MQVFLNSHVMSLASQGVHHACSSGANRLVEKWFADCVYRPLDTIAFFVGLSSVCFWLIAQLPQFISNIVRSAADALSPWFLFQWLAGDTLNLLGCILSADALKTQIITAGYFICSDIIIIAQYLYYQIKNRKGFDESVHKGSGYCQVVDCSSSKYSSPGHLPSQRLQSDDLKDDLFHRNRQGISNQFVSSECMRSDLSEESRNNKVKPLDCVQFEQKLHQQVISHGQDDCWMFEQRHRLRRLVYEHNLEYGYRMDKHLALLYHNVRMSKYRSSKSRTSQVKPQFRNFLEKHAPSKEAWYKAVLGIVGFFGILFVPNFHFPAIQDDFGSARVGIRLHRRTLLALEDSGNTARESSSLMKTLQSPPIYTAYQHWHLGHRIHPWTMLIGRFLGWDDGAHQLCTWAHGSHNSLRINKGNQ
ncbi:hypothetical protein KP509_02G003200 [Ceratopteris richardii]|uniref:Uncharacterized protein n=1 Tax=Ceratopteris richardii TaxID=49495 RepID=A0A8T2V2Z3_CERRI|nr:hypothetical protein KP509_02G003200 [Ceratopteris richardii]